MVETLVIILFVLAMASCSLQFTLFPLRRIMWGCLAGIAIYVYLMYSRAIEQSYSAFLEILSDSPLMTDFAVVQVIEAIGGLLISIFLIRFHYNEPVKRYFRFLVYFPGIIVFPSIFYAESYLFLQVPGINFQVLAIVLAIAFPLFLLVGKWLITSLIPEFDLRLELKFGIHIIQLVCAVILSVVLFRLPVKTAALSVSVNQLIALLTTVLLFTAFGMLWYNFRMKRLNNKYKNG